MRASEVFWASKALLSHYWRYPWQTLFLLFGLIAGVALWSAVQLINGHARASYAQADSLLGAQATHWIKARQGNGIDPVDYIDLRRRGFRELYPVIEARTSTAAGQPLSLIATDLLALPAATAGRLSEVQTGKLAWLELIQKPYQAWVPKQIARELSLNPGDTVSLRDGRTLPPVRVYSHAQQGRNIFLDIGAAMEVLGESRFSYLGVAAIDAQRVEQLKNALPDSYRLEKNRQQLDLTEITASLHTHLAAMSLLSFAVGLFIVFNAVRFSLWHRLPTLRNLRLLGVGMRAIAVAIMLETLAWSVIGCVLGLWIGYGLSLILLPGLSASLLLSTERDLVHSL